MIHDPAQRDLQQPALAFVPCTPSLLGTPKPSRYCSAAPFHHIPDISDTGTARFSTTTTTTAITTTTINPSQRKV
ncbi:hypothetical protein E2C01_032224 [Portunus trituberculatus]|uniref:Uncharacterized protein n=1 Tax=Portunus trituberculatus TaxID=210409 RepID=A0A5B7EWY9_PORTR|nr:hypothetical protein [Portunus trituberculatus]